MIIQTPMSDKIKYMYPETNNDSDTVRQFYSNKAQIRKQ